MTHYSLSANEEQQERIKGKSEEKPFSRVKAELARLMQSGREYHSSSPNYGTPASNSKTSQIFRLIKLHYFGFYT